MEKQQVQASMQKKQNLRRFTTGSVKIIALMLFLINGLLLLSQDRPFTYGFVASVDFQTLGISTQAQREDAPYLSSINRTGAGAGFGAWGRWQLMPVVSLRPGLQFSQTTNFLEFTTSDGQVLQSRYTFSDIAVPLHLLISDHFENLPLSAVILFGGHLSWNLTKTNPSNPIRFLPERFGLDIGIGAGFKIGSWTVQPEFTYSYGVNNIHDFQNTPFDWAVGRILRDRLSLRVVVEVGD